jgi:hypothetical protein
VYERDMECAWKVYERDMECAWKVYERDERGMKEV